MIIETYDRLASGYADLYGRELDKKPYDRARLDVVHGESAQGLPILELGCGPGQAAHYLAQQGSRVLATDASREMVRIARERFAHPNVEHMVMDFSKLTLEAGSAGGVVAMNAFIHLPREALRDQLTHIARVMKPGAPILFTLYRGEGTRELDTLPDLAPLPVTLYERGELTELLESIREFDRVRVESRRAYPWETPLHRIFVTSEARSR